MYIMANEYRDLVLLIQRSTKRKSEVDGIIQLMHLSTSHTYLDSSSGGQGDADASGGSQCWLFFFTSQTRGKLVPVIVLYLYLFSDSMLVVFLVLLTSFLVVDVVLVVNASSSLKIVNLMNYVMVSGLFTSLAIFGCLALKNNYQMESLLDTIFV